MLITMTEPNELKEQIKSIMDSYVFDSSPNSLEKMFDLIQQREAEAVDRFRDLINNLIRYFNNKAYLEYGYGDIDSSLRWDSMTYGLKILLDSLANPTESEE